MGATESLALKLALTPLLIGGASLAARRWGPEAGGWLVGIVAFVTALIVALALQAASLLAGRRL